MHFIFYFSILLLSAINISILLFLHPLQKRPVGFKKYDFRFNSWKNLKFDIVSQFVSCVAVNDTENKLGEQSSKSAQSPILTSVLLSTSFAAILGLNSGLDGASWL